MTGHFISESQLPTIAIDGGLSIEGLKPEKQPGQHIRRIDGEDREASDEEIQRYYIDEVKKLGGKSIGIWSATIALAVSSSNIVIMNYEYKTLFTSEPKGRIVEGAALDTIMIEPSTKRYYSEMKNSERPDIKYVLQFFREYKDRL